jgi:thiamine biosynthesis protein ThiI
VDLILKIAGEIGTKSAPTRRRFLRALASNARAAFRRRGIRGTVEPRWSRLFVRTDDPAASAALSRIFGVHSVARTEALRFTSLNDLVEQAEPALREVVRGRTFALRVRRRGEHDFRSRDVAVALGDRLRPASAGVDLGHPQVEIPIEISDDTAHLLQDALSGPGGLPSGVGGRALSLFSGGFDSPVATWMAWRRGIATDLLVCDLGGCGQVDAALGVARELATTWASGVEPAVHVVDLAPVVAALRARVEGGIRQVVLKRAMYRAAALVAARIGADALVTGEALGQVSTQTLRNLTVAEDAADMPVLRPLIGMDKDEIIARARHIGTHDLSVRVQEHCDISTGRVETAARLQAVVGAEGRLDESFIAAAVERATRVDLTTWAPGPLPEHIVSEVPPGAVVIDVRPLEEGPTVGDTRLPFALAHEWTSGLESGKTYLFVCTHGNRSEIVAHDLRRRGVDAYSLSGGVSRLPTRAA